MTSRTETTKRTSIFGTDEQIKQFLKKIDGSIDELFERAARLILHEVPDDLNVSIVLYDDAKGVQDFYYKRYKQKVNFIAFASLSLGTVFISIEDLTRPVIAHELAHVIVAKTFKVRPFYQAHEVIAQYVERYIDRPLANGRDPDKKL